jgi:hypothetical protein
MKDKATNANWQARVGSEDSSDDIDTESMKHLQDPFESTLAMDASMGADPYSNMPNGAGLRKRRRTLDDMRKLDDQIKRARATNKNGQ